MKIQKYLELSPIFAINSVYEAVIPHFNKRLKKEGVHFLQGLVLTALFFENNPEVTPSALATLFRTSRGNMSHIVSHLESKGWVRRNLNPQDARQFHIELKAEGRKKAIALIKIYDQVQELFEKELGAGACQKTTAQMHQLTAIYRARA